MNISNWKLVTKFLFGGGVSGVIEYVLEILNNALAALPGATQVKIQAVLNIALKVLNVLNAVKWLVPTKWQTAYMFTLEAVSYAVSALTDLNITTEEIAVVREKVEKAIDAWKSPDDETCVELKCVNGVYQIA